MTTRRPSNEDRLAAIDARLPKPAFEETPGLEWLQWLSVCELDILEHVVGQVPDRSLPVDFGRLESEAGPLAAAIITGAMSRQTLGWPRHEDDPGPYDRLDHELGLLQKAHEIRFGRG
jgi:hypothetical protein